MHSLSNLKYVGIFNYKTDIYDKKKRSNLRKNSLFSKWYTISNIIETESYK